MSQSGFHGAKAAVFIGNRLLVYLRDDRPDIPFPAHWDFPGGGREGDETPEQTLARELHEEFGLDAAGARVLWVRELPALHHPDARVWFYVLHFPDGTEDHIVFGDEGQHWALMSWETFCRQDRVVPSFAPRMALWRQETGGKID